MVRVLFLFLTRFHVNELNLLFKCKFIIRRFCLVNMSCDSLKIKGSTYSADVTHLSRRFAIDFSLNNNQKSFSFAMDQVFLFAFNGELEASSL